MATSAPWTYQDVRDALIRSVMGCHKHSGDVDYKLLFFTKSDMRPLGDDEMFNWWEVYVVKRMPLIKFTDDMMRVCRTTGQVVRVNTGRVSKPVHREHNYNVYGRHMPRLIGLHGHV